MGSRRRDFYLWKVISATSSFLRRNSEAVGTPSPHRGKLKQHRCYSYHLSQCFTYDTTALSLLSFIGSMSISMSIDSLAGVLEGVGFGVGQDLIAGVQVGSGLASFKTSRNEGLIFPA